MSKKPPAKDKSSADSATADIEEVIADSATADKEDFTEVLASDPDPVQIGEAAADKEEVVADSATADKEDFTEVLASDPDPVQIGEAAAQGKAETRAAAGSLPDAPAGTDSNRILADVVSQPAAAVAASASSPKASFPWFGLFNFLLILALAGAAGYYWREQQKLAADIQASNQADLVNMQQQLQLVEQTSSSRLQSSLSPLEDRIGNLNNKVDELGLGQQSLRESGEKLYQLFGQLPGVLVPAE